MHLKEVVEDGRLVGKRDIKFDLVRALGYLTLTQCAEILVKELTSIRVDRGTHRPHLCTCVCACAWK